MPVRIDEATMDTEIPLVRELFQEYASSLEIDLEFQDFTTELATLPGDYAPPGGRILLAREEGRVAGCVGFRPFAGHDCEMKRLYVRPAFRGRGVGQRLARRAIDEARTAGYSRMLLDTLASMITARGLYAELGFHEIPPYRHNPIPGAVFMALDL